MRNLLAVIGLILLLAAPAFGAANTTHGQDCDSTTTVFAAGRYRTLECINVCNNYAAVDDDAECTEYEFKGLPDLIVLEKVENDASCSADVTFTITTGPVTGGTPGYDLDTTAVALNDASDRAVIDVSQAPIDAFLFINVTNDTACTDVDVVMHLLYHKP